MATYDYECQNCAAVIEVQHKMSETYSDPCAKCGGPVVKVFLTTPAIKMADIGSNGKWQGDSSKYLKDQKRKEKLMFGPGFKKK